MSTKFIRPSMPGQPRKVLAPNPVNDAYSKKVVGGAPVVFSAQAYVPIGQNVVLNAQTLQSGFRTPYFIDEIRISMDTGGFYKTSPRGVIKSCTGLSGAVAIKFQTGNYYFSNDYIPVGLMGPVFSNFDYGEVNVGLDTDTGLFQRMGYSTVRWALPKPLYMPPGDVVLANVQVNDTLNVLSTLLAGDFPPRVTVTYVGRLVPPGFVSPTRDIPWLAWFQKKASEAWKSSETRFRNPFLIPAHVQRFTSRTYLVRNNSSSSSHHVAMAARAASSSSAGAEFTNPVGVGSGVIYNEMSAAAQVASPVVPFEEVMLSDSRGYSIVSKYAPVGEVFDATRKIWTFGRELTSREQFNMTARTGNVPGSPPAPLGTNEDYLTNFGLVGYRSEAP